MKLDQDKIDVPFKYIGNCRELWVISRKQAVEISRNHPNSVYYYCTQEEILFKVKNENSLNSVYGDNYFYLFKLPENVYKKMYKILDLSLLVTFLSMVFIIICFSIGFSFYLAKEDIISSNTEIEFYVWLFLFGVLSYLGVHCLVNYGAFGNANKKAELIANEYVNSLIGDL